MEPKKGRVTGIGGIFFKCEDPDKMKDWYSQHLGMKTDQYGSMFESRDANNPEQINYLQWSTFKEDTEYFHPSEKQYMINYRVENIEALVEQLKKNGISVVDQIEEYEYGKFVHVMDPEGNKLELWEPIDSVFEESGDEGKTK